LKLQPVHFGKYKPFTVPDFRFRDLFQAHHHRLPVLLRAFRGLPEQFLSYKGHRNFLALTAGTGQKSRELLPVFLISSRRVPVEKGSCVTVVFVQNFIENINRFFVPFVFNQVKASLKGFIVLISNSSDPFFLNLFLQAQINLIFLM